ncbi:hypothetical protein ILUMI_09721 [Ignelater luminosus]|uniref:Peptidase M14 domain-containing protein n=1 Tax=Ignelater luminosus TaxID=2038154 RepID=A0A8K0D3C3_IGNLU|nr:hypothetical protein ILUMI_09721 [Ignelater luminosus]
MKANEWISSATALYAIQQLAENPVNNYMLAKADWYFIPIMNPDGFDYSHKQDHTWKKTRSRRVKTDNTCFGVDLNQNFDSGCNFTNLQNRSCNNGENSFSEPEANAMLDFLTKNFQVELFININNYGQSIDYPLETDARYIDDNNDLKFVAEKASYAIYKYGGYKYTVNGFDSCGSEHWARRQGIKYVYNIKLPAGEELGPKSQVPESEILSIAQEVFVAFRQLQQILVSIYGVTYDLITDD